MHVLSFSVIVFESLQEFIEMGVGVWIAISEIHLVIVVLEGVCET